MTTLRIYLAAASLMLLPFAPAFPAEDTASTQITPQPSVTNPPTVAPNPKPAAATPPSAAQVTPVQTANPPTTTSSPATIQAAPALQPPANKPPIKPAVPTAAPATPPAALPHPAPPVRPAIAPAAQQPAIQPAPRITPALPMQTPAVQSAPRTAVPALPVTKPVVPVLPKPSATPALPAKAAAQPEAADNIIAQTADIEMFIRENCPNCEKARQFLAKLQSYQPQLKISIRDVRKEPAALELLKRISQNQGSGLIDYPAFVVNGQLMVGFSDDDSTAQKILDNLPLTHSTSSPDEECQNGSPANCGLLPAPAPEKSGITSFNILGQEFTLSQIGLPLFTLATGWLDGMSSGSTWVLVLMLSLLAPLKDRPRMISIAGTFLAVHAVFYLILIVIWFNIISILDTVRYMQFVFIAFAVITSAYYLRLYLLHDHRLSITSSEIDNQGIYTHIRKIMERETLVGTIAATMMLSLLVLFTQFNFKSVFPALYARILSEQDLGTLANMSYLMLYDFSYMLNDLLIFSACLMTMKQERDVIRPGRRIKLLSALLLICIAVFLFKTR